METSTAYASDGEKPKKRHYECPISSATEFEKLKLRRPKVSAVRDFPVGFEQTNAQSNSCKDGSNAEPYHTDHVEPNYNSCHSEENDSSLCSLESEEETDDGFDCAKLRIKRRKVSAIRDFPVAFQKFGAQANNGAAGYSDGDVVELLEIDHYEPCESDHVEHNKNSITLSSEETDSCLRLQPVVQTDDGCYLSGDLDNATHNDTLEVLDREKSDKLELHYALNKVSDFAKVGFKWPKVSAIRDFPVAFEQFGAQANGTTVNDLDSNVDEPLEVDPV